jgi:hypothetical protein
MSVKPRRYSLLDILVLAGTALFLAVLALAVEHDLFVNWLLVLFGAGLLVFAVKPWIEQRRRDRLADELELDALGVTRRFRTRSRGTVIERIAWNEVEAIDIVTTDAGPFVVDFFFVLSGNGRGVVVPLDLATKNNFVQELQNRFPDLDNGVIISASGSTRARQFVVWRKAGSRTLS